MGLKRLVEQHDVTVTVPIVLIHTFETSFNHIYIHTTMAAITQEVQEMPEDGENPSWLPLCASRLIQQVLVSYSRILGEL